jgi:hypothetical protein
MVSKSTPRHTGSNKSPLDPNYKRSAFIRATLATRTEADIYLEKMSLHVAIDRYLAEHSFEGPIEDI